jgi:UDP-4-amino-4,6-dideoxy-N-acetyl-beta-L-altrosamine N-acetyltransferase
MYTFINFNKINDFEKMQVFVLRNNASVRKWMFNSENISWNQHNKFFEKLVNDKTKQYFYVERNNLFIGVYSIINIKNSSGQGGFYISTEAVKKKLAVEFIFYSIKYIFENTNIKKIYGLEDINNRNVFTINRLFGFYNNYEDSTKEINGLLYRFGEISSEDFNITAGSSKLQVLIQFSKSIKYEK